MDRYHNIDGNRIQFTSEEEALADADDAQSVIDIALWDAQAYARNRKAEYPALADQLDEIYHNGIDSWKAVIKVTKDKYPKG